MEEQARALAGLVESIVVPLVEDKDQVEVQASVTDANGIFVEISVADGDAGKVIGRQGRVINSIRTLARAAASRMDAQVDVEITN